MLDFFKHIYVTHMLSRVTKRGQPSGNGVINIYELPTFSTKPSTKYLNEELLTHPFGMGLGTGHTKQNTCFARKKTFPKQF